MQHLPIGIDLRDKRCLVVGGGDVATRKLERLLDAGAAVTVVSVSASARLAELQSNGEIQVQLRRFEESDLDNMRFVVAATSDAKLNQEIARIAEARELWCNTAENSDNNPVIFPSLIRRDPVVISISSGGSSPVLARVLSAQLDAFVPQSIGPSGRSCL